MIQNRLIARARVTCSTAARYLETFRVSSIEPNSERHNSRPLFIYLLLDSLDLKKI
jgi:hypothetical protein